MQKLFLLKRVLCHSAFETKYSAYVTLIRPILEYANIVWFLHTRNNTYTLEKFEGKLSVFLITVTSVQIHQLSSHNVQAFTPWEPERNYSVWSFLYMLLHNPFKLTYSDTKNFKSTSQIRQMRPNILEELSCNNTAWLIYIPQAVRK